MPKRTIVANGGRQRRNWQVICVNASQRSLSGRGREGDLGRRAAPEGDLEDSNGNNERPRHGKSPASQLSHVAGDLASIEPDGVGRRAGRDRRAIRVAVSGASGGTGPATRQG